MTYQPKTDAEVNRESDLKLADVAKYPKDELSWLRNAYRTNVRAIEALRRTCKDLRERLVRETGNRPISVEEAQALHCCRVCKGPVTAPFVLNFGEEHAHKKCLRETRTFEHGITYMKNGNSREDLVDEKIAALERKVAELDSRLASTGMERIG